MNARVWQANFMGGGRLYQLVSKMSDCQTLGEYLDEKVKNCGWKIAEGWIESADSKDVRRVKLLSLKENRDEYEVQEFIKLEEKYKADWITGFEYVETSDFTDEGISKVRICTDKYFLRPRAKNKEILLLPIF